MLKKNNLKFYKLNMHRRKKYNSYDKRNESFDVSIIKNYMPRNVSQKIKRKSKVSKLLTKNSIYKKTELTDTIQNTIFQVLLMVKNLPANAGDIRDAGSVTGSGRSPGQGQGNPLQYSCQEKPMGRGVWWATIHRVTESQT